MESENVGDLPLKPVLPRDVPVTLARPQWREMAVEVSARLCCALTLGIFAYAAILQWRVAPERLTVLLLALASSLTVGLSLFARIPEKRDWRASSIALSVGGTFYFLAIELRPGIRLIPEQVGASLCCAGILWQLFAKVSLRRSFGILPANRGIVTRGAYRVVRHPIYLGYFITDMGFLSTNFGWRNLLVYAGLYVLQIGRLLREERLLSDDPEYRAYQADVRYRVIPGVF